jgi:hypothetical protein
VLDARDPRFLLDLVRALWRHEIEPSAVGLGFLVVGAMMTLGGVGAVAMGAVLPPGTSLPLPPALDALRPVLENFVVLATLQAGLGLAVVAAALAFRRGRRWARPVLDAVAAAFAGWTGWFGVLWVGAVLSSTQHGPLPVRVVGLAMTVLGSLFCAGLALVGVLAIRYLHGPRVAAHLSGGGANPLVR